MSERASELERTDLEEWQWVGQRRNGGVSRRSVMKSAGTMGAGLLLSGTGVSRAGSDPLDEIEILTDEYNESHIYADSLYGLAYGNGYVQAGDRLFQMDVIRHVGYGDSAKVLGPAQIPSDIQVKRDLYSEEEIERQYENASEKIRTALEGFADGVNRKMTEMAAQGKLPAEFAALGHPPEPWKPEDSVAAIDYLIGFFGVSGGSELTNAKTLVQLQESLETRRAAHDAYEDLNWLETRPEHFTSIPDEDKTVEGGETVPDFEAVPDEQLAFAEAVWTETDSGEKTYGVKTWGIETDVTIPDAITEGRREGHGVLEGFKWGSNALVVDGDLTETGEPMLGGGPQMGYFKPPIPYEVGLHGAGFDNTGMGIVGVPSAIIGRNSGSAGNGDGADLAGPDGDTSATGTGRDALAYTVTSGRDDMIDTIAVELDPQDKHRYKWQGMWYEMETHRVTHYASPVTSAAAGDPETRVVEQEVARISPPGVDQEMPVIAWNPDPVNVEHPVAWAQRITSRNDELRGASIWSEIGRVTDLDDFEDSFAEFPFTFNFHLVSGSGDIEYVHTGKVPMRDDTLDHRLPATAEHHEWNGTFYTQQGAPSDPEGSATVVRNPSRGYVVNWNNGPAAGWRAGDSEQNWGSIHRVEELDHWVREHLGVSEGVPDGSAVKRAATERLTIEDVKVIISRAALHDASAQFSVPFLIEAARNSDDDRLASMADLLERWRDSYCAWYDEEPAGSNETYYPPTHGDDPANPDDNDTYGDGRYIHAGHAIYDETRKRLQSLVFGDELDVAERPGIADETQRQYSTVDFEVPQSRHAGDHGEVFDDVTLYDALRGETTHDWMDDVTTAGSESRDQVVRTALSRAATALEERFDTGDPNGWHQPVHTSKFRPLGATETEEMDMRNRASYNQAIEIDRAQRSPNAGTDWERYAGDVMPPSNSGQITATEFTQAQATGREPERLHDQLELYVYNQYKPHPVTREQVEAVTTSRQTLRTTHSSLDSTVELSGDVPLDSVAHLLDRAD